MLDRLR